MLFTDNPAGVSGTDGGYSIPMGDRTLWMFGDVFLYRPGADMRISSAISNCGLIVPRGSGPSVLRNYHFLTDPKTGLARQLLPYEAGENKTVRIWPGGGWYDEAGKRVYLFYQKVHTTGTGPLDFNVDGSGLAGAEASHPNSLQFERIKTLGKGLWWEWPREPLFGCAVVSGSPGPSPYVYVLGAKDPPIKRAALARVKQGNAANREAYEYFAGAGAESARWSRSAVDAATIAGLDGFPNELSISYNRWLRGYLAVHGQSLTSKLTISVAAQPWGPFRPLHEVEVPKQAFSKGFCYAAKEHPELAEQNGRVIYVTYVDSSRYWLQLLKITLPEERYP